MPLVPASAHHTSWTVLSARLGYRLLKDWLGMSKMGGTAKQQLRLSSKVMPGAGHDAANQAILSLIAILCDTAHTILWLYSAGRRLQKQG